MEKQYFISKEQFVALLAAWKASTHHTAAEHIIYNILRSKDARLGFIERKSNIQGDNPWYAYKLAREDAMRLCSLANPWEKYSDPASPYHKSYLGGQKQVEERQKRFKDRFGIDVPEGIMELLEGAK